VPASSGTFTVLASTGALTASFANLVSGTRVISTDGTGSFAVSSTGNKIILSNYTAITPPAITSQPASVSIPQGSAFTLAVKASSSAIAPISYQWYQNGVAIPSATGSNYVVASAQTSNAGQFYVTVANIAGSTTSNTVNVTVLIPPTAPTGLSTLSGNAQVTLTWNAPASAAGYIIQRGTSSGVYTSSFSNITSTSYTDNSVTNEITYYYVVTATNAGGSSAPSAEATARPVLPFGATETAAPTVALSGSTASSVTVPTVAGRIYQLQSCDNLSQGTWVNVGSPVTGTGAPLNLQDAAVQGVAHRFYRVQITQ